MSLSLRLFAALGALVLPGVALAAPRNFQELAELLVGLIDNATFVLITFGLVVYFWGLASNIPHFGDEKGAEKLKNYFFWGIIVLVVMVSIWGIVQLLQNTLFGNSSYDPTTGQAAAEGGLCTGFNCD